MLSSVNDEKFLNQIRTLLKLHIQKKGAAAWLGEKRFLDFFGSAVLMMNGFSIGFIFRSAIILRKKKAGWKHEESERTHEPCNRNHLRHEKTAYNLPDFAGCISGMQFHFGGGAYRWVTWYKLSSILWYDIFKARIGSATESSFVTAWLFPCQFDTKAEIIKKGRYSVWKNYRLWNTITFVY